LQRAAKLVQKHPNDEGLQASAALGRASALFALGDPDTAYPLFERARQLFDTAFPNGHSDRARAQVSLTEPSLDRNDPVRARALLDASGPLLKKNLVANGPTRQGWQRLGNRLR
jgi:hypothetical protein